MDFFARQEQSRRTSRALVGAFVLAFVIVAIATTIVVAAALRLYTENNALFLGTESWQQWLAGHGGLVLGVAAGTFGLMVVASLYRAATLARGGGHVARMLGATRVSGEGSDPLARRLVNVVEEIALASGLPVPEIYILEQEAGINAFAAGLTSADAAIAVTRGALEQLERAELQGVIAHEFSHILNGDMRLNHQLIGLSFGILVLSLAGRWLLRSVRYTGGGRRGKNSGGIAAAVAIGLALVVIGGIGVLLSRLIKAGVSRQREALADASAVQFTREPEGLAGALKKIGGYSARIVSVDTEEVAHMLFERGTRPFSGWLATHPPLMERIRALEPNFDPSDLPPPKPVARTGFVATTPGAATSGLVEAAGTAPATESPLERAGEIAAPAGRALRAAVPDEVYHATRSRDSSLLVVLALALSNDEATRRQQLALVEQQLGATRAELCGRLFADLARASAELRLPVLELALPTLRERPREQLVYLSELLTRLRELEKTPRLFDFVLLRVLNTYLRDLPGATPAASRRASSLATRSAVRALLANVAAYGTSDAAGARAAYAAGLASVGWRAEAADPTFDPAAAARDLDLLDAALAALTSIRPRDKERVLRGVLAVIRADAVTGVEERELFRVIAIVLDCPLPPDVTL
ncbi:MAG TPA: M48 family metallopeptidase [Gammaproteobacteria bacterium]|nr:M48 family metallopeptidase [Gammaproteobacteria bacterium]